MGQIGQQSVLANKKSALLLVISNVLALCILSLSYRGEIIYIANQYNGSLYNPNRIINDRHQHLQKANRRPVCTNDRRLHEDGESRVWQEMAIISQKCIASINKHLGDYNTGVSHPPLKS